MLSSKWLWTKEQIINSPSRKNYTLRRELWIRHHGGEIIQSLGNKLRLPQMIVNTASIYMHRFYMEHSLSTFPYYVIAPVCLFLAAKVEDCPRKVEHFIKLSQKIEDPTSEPINTSTQEFDHKVQSFLIYENIVLQTLAFDFSVTHAGADICQAAQTASDVAIVPRQIAHFAYTMANLVTRSTPICLQYRTEEIAAACLQYVISKPPDNTDKSGTKELWKLVKPDWLEQFNHIIKKFSNVSRKPAFENVTPERIKSCLEDLHFWIKDFKEKARLRILNPREIKEQPSSGQTTSKTDQTRLVETPVMRITTSTVTKDVRNVEIFPSNTEVVASSTGSVSTVETISVIKSPSFKAGPVTIAGSSSVTSPPNFSGSLKRGFDERTDLSEMKRSKLND